VRGPPQAPASVHLDEARVLARAAHEPSIGFLEQKVRPATFEQRQLVTFSNAQLGAVRPQAVENHLANPHRFARGYIQ
jgi:hypothetical protein